MSHYHVSRFNTRKISSTSKGTDKRYRDWTDQQVLDNVGREGLYPGIRAEARARNLISS
jgi:hypothetical protein